MPCSDYSCNVITNDGFKPAVKSRNVWGVAFKRTAPWPKLMCVQEYDGSPDKNGRVEFHVENGHAVYQFVERCEYGSSNHFKLIESTDK